MKKFLEKMTHYFDNYRYAYWGDPGWINGGGENWPLMFSILEAQQRAGNRRIVYAPLVDERGEVSSEVRIRARMDDHFHEICQFFVDRTVLPHFSAHFSGKEEVAESPLALSFFEIEGVEEVLMHGSVITITRDSSVMDDWHEMGREIGRCIRDHIQSNLPAVTDEFIRRIPPQEEIEARVQEAIDERINPVLEEHTGKVWLERINRNTVWINMAGRCQGCAAAPFTMRHGIADVLRNAVPQIGAIYDATDHTTGINPYFVRQGGMEVKHE